MFLLAPGRTTLHAASAGINARTVATLSGWIAAVTVLVSLVACGKRAEDTIVGTWMEPQKGPPNAPIRFTEVRFRLILTPDNRIVAEHVRSVNGEVIRHETGIYTLQGDEIKVNITSGRIPRSYTVKRVGNRLVRETGIGERIEYVRTGSS